MRAPPPQRIVAVVGLPGSGKSTHSAALARALGGTAASVGDWLRARAAAGDAGARATVARGDPISPDQYRRFLAHTLPLVGSCLLILDGSPRDAQQVEILADVLPPGQAGRRVSGVLLDLPVARAEQRVRRRQRGDSPRPDDQPRAVARRMAYQAEALRQLRVSFESRWPLAIIDATAEVESIRQQILRWLERADPAPDPSGSATRRFD